MASPQGGSLCPLTTPKQALPSTHIPRGQAQGKPCPLPRRAIDRQLAVHRPRQPARDIEAEPRSAAIGAPQPFKFLEHDRLLLGVDPLPLVGNRHRRAVAVAVDADPYLRIFGRIADRIAEQVEQHLQHAPELARRGRPVRSEEHTSELQSLMRISYAVFRLKKKKPKQ